MKEDVDVSVSNRKEIDFEHSVLIKASDLPNLSQALKAINHDNPLYQESSVVSKKPIGESSLFSDLSSPQSIQEMKNRFNKAYPLLYYILGKKVSSLCVLPSTSQIHAMKMRLKSLVLLF